MLCVKQTKIGTEQDLTRAGVLDFIVIYNDFIDPEKSIHILNFHVSLWTH